MVCWFKSRHQRRSSIACPEAVSSKITAAFPELSLGQKQVARFVVDNKPTVACATVSETAQEAGVSTATVVRFCQRLGYDGYSDLQGAVQRELPRFVTTARKLEETLAAPIPDNDILGQVFATNIDNMKRTLALMDRTDWEDAVNEICQVTGILVVGEALSEPLAVLLRRSLKLMGFHADAVTSGGASLSLEISTLKPSDLLIGVGFWRYSQDTIDAMRWARRVGASRVALTDSEVSPLAQLADYTFVAATTGISHSKSLVGPISLIDAFIVALSLKRPQQTLEILRAVDATRASRLLTR